MNVAVLRRPIVLASAVGAISTFALWQLTGEGTALFAFALALAGLPLSLQIAGGELARVGRPDPPADAHRLRASIALGAVFSAAALAALFARDLSASGSALFLSAFLCVWFALLAARCLHAAVRIRRRLH